MDALRVCADGTILAEDMPGTLVEGRKTELRKIKSRQSKAKTVGLQKRSEDMMEDAGNGSVQKLS